MASASAKPNINVLMERGQLREASTQTPWSMDKHQLSMRSGGADDSSTLPRLKVKVPYSKEEDEKIIRFMLQDEHWRLMKYNTVWTALERFIPGRTGSSLKERFRKNLQAKLHTYNLTEDEQKKLRWTSRHSL